MKKLSIAIAAFGLALLELPSPVLATPSDGIFVSSPATGQIHVAISEAQEADGLVIIAPVPTGFGLIGTIDMFESPTGALSDQFGYLINPLNGQQEFFFTSDPNFLSELPPVTGTIVENGKRQNVTTLLFGDNPPVPHLRFFVLSDTNASPEPASMALFAMGLAGMIALRWRTRAV